MGQGDGGGKEGEESSQGDGLHGWLLSGFEVSGGRWECEGFRVLETMKAWRRRKEAIMLVGTYTYIRGHTVRWLRPVESSSEVAVFQQNRLGNRA